MIVGEQVVLNSLLLMSSGCGVGVAGRDRRGLLLSRRMLRAALL